MPLPRLQATDPAAIVPLNNVLESRAYQVELGSADFDVGGGATRAVAGSVFPYVQLPDTGSPYLTAGFLRPAHWLNGSLFYHYVYTSDTNDGTNTITLDERIATLGSLAAPTTTFNREVLPSPATAGDPLLRPIEVSHAVDADDHAVGFSIVRLTSDSHTGAVRIYGVVIRHIPERR